MPYLVDGSNLGGFLGGAAGARDRQAVVRRMLPWARRRRVVVVFDGPDDGSLARAYGGVEVRYSGRGSADAAIRRLVAREPSSWLVVTADRALGAACRAAGAEILSVADMLARIDLQGAADDAAGEPDPPVDVADWEAWFRAGKDPGEPL